MMAVERWRWGHSPQLARELVEEAGILAIPTESSYGLGVDPRNRLAVDRLFALKGRPPDKALPVVAGGIEQLDLLGVEWQTSPLSPLTELWPAALTLVLPLRSPIAASANERSLAVRIPDHPRLRSFLLALGTPLTATSANPSTEPPLIDPNEVAKMLDGSHSMVVDEGVLPGGPPSTIVGWVGGAMKVFRHGRYPVGRIESCLLRARESTER